jgi:hypothetical protein
MSNLQIARDILERAQDAQDFDMVEAALVCVRAFKWGYKTPAREWAMVKAFWAMLQEDAA